MNEKIQVIVSAVVATAAVGLAYYLGRKDNEKLSTFREKWAFSKGLLFASMRTSEDTYIVMKGSSNQTQEVEALAEENYTKMKEYLEQTGLWNEYRAFYPEREE